MYYESFVFLFMQSRSYVVTVVATDNGMPEPFNTTVDVVVTVVMPDNHFNPVLNQTSYTATVDENRPPGDVIISFTVEDNDEPGPAAEIGQLVFLGGDAQFFVAEITGPNSGQIRTKYVTLMQ